MLSCTRMLMRGAPALWSAVMPQLKQEGWRLPCLPLSGLPLPAAPLLCDDSLPQPLVGSALQILVIEASNCTHRGKPSRVLESEQDNLS